MKPSLELRQNLGCRISLDKRPNGGVGFLPQIDHDGSDDLLHIFTRPGINAIVLAAIVFKTDGLRLHRDLLALKLAVIAND